MTEIERAKYLLEGLDRRENDRLKDPTIAGHWPTELNQVRQILWHLINVIQQNVPPQD